MSVDRICDKYSEKNLGLSWDLNFRSPVLRIGVLPLDLWDTDTNSESKLPLIFSYCITAALVLEFAVKDLALSRTL